MNDAEVNILKQFSLLRGFIFSFPGGNDSEYLSIFRLKQVAEKGRIERAGF